MKPAYDDAIRVPAKRPNETWLEHISRFVAYLPVELDFTGERIRKPLLLTAQACQELLQETKPYLHYAPPQEGVVNLIYGHPVIVEEPASDKEQNG